jgi:hypothetical protein
LVFAWYRSAELLFPKHTLHHRLGRFVQAHRIEKSSYPWEIIDLSGAAEQFKPF